MTAVRILSFLAFVVFIAAGITASPAHAQDRETPYWASLRYDEVRMRVGPSGEYKIEWLYRRKGLPVKVVRMREGWRLVQDPEGVQGWIAASQLTLDRGALIIGDGLVDMRALPDASSSLQWRAEPGVVGRLLGCREEWCELDVTGRRGWVPADRIWGAGEP
ncbi:hypothetical protein FGU71_12110 [Erythrobacter insulae]|uniref:SH3b domain-containing protein n=1 Tax=Erythrobacter insulae TaxID=2584124 RepID=A0A547PEP5_9SPHN|nr:SH3 domain-containing protein [Erythrobacter insulae]TRD12534.1 hypothetical protein FGU71_12110 [Erythrobacter insulae]